MNELEGPYCIVLNLSVIRPKIMWSCHIPLYSASLFYSFPLSTADTRRFSVEENEFPHSGNIHRCNHRHGYEKQEALCLTTAKPSKSKCNVL